MTVVFLTSASTSPWSRPGDWADAGHTVNLVGAGGRGGVTVTGTSYRSGSGGGGGGHVLNTYSSGALSSTTPFYVTIDSFGITADAAATAWGSGTSAITNSYYVQGGTSGIAGGTAGSGGATTTTLNGTPPTPVYTQSQKNNGGAGGPNAATTTSGGGGGGAGGPTGVGGTGGSSVTASYGGGGGGASNGGGNASPASDANGTQGGGGGGAGGTSGTPAGGNATAASGDGGGGGFFSAVASANTRGGDGGNEDNFTGFLVTGTTQAGSTSTAGPGGGGGGGGANSVNTAGATTSGGAGASYGAGGGGAGGTRSGTSTRTPGTGASGLIVITYTGTPPTGTLAATEAPDVAAINGRADPVGTLAATGAPDVAAFAGLVSAFGTLVATEAADVASVIGTVFTNVTGTLAASAGPDVASLAGTVAGGGAAGTVAYGSQGTYLTYGSRTNSTLVAPSGIADGDFLLAYLFIGSSPGPTSVTAPAGWTAIPNSPIPAADGSGFVSDYHIYYKTASSESGSYVFTHSAASTCGVVIRYTGVDTASPFSPTPTTHSELAFSGSGDIATATGFTTTVANTFVIFAEHDWADNTTDTVVPTGTTPTFTERVDQTLIYVADGTLASAGATGDKAHTCNSTINHPNSAYLIGLKPGAAGEPTGTLAATEGPDVAAFPGGTVAWNAALAVTEAANTASVAGNVAWNATLAVTETADVAAFTATAVTLGTLAVTEASDVASLAGAVVTNVTGTLAATEAADVATATGTVEWRATLAATEATNVAAFGSTVAWNAALAVTEAADVASLAGTVSGGAAGTVAYGSQGTYLSYASRTNSTLVAPASIANGNLLIAYLFVGAASSAPSVTAPAGWTALTGSPTSSFAGGFNGTYHIFYKVASSEAGNYTFTHATGNSCGVVIRYTGVDTSAPLSPTPTANTGGGDIAEATGFTTTVANTFVIFTEHDWSDNSSDTVVPTGTTPTFTERLDDVLIYIADGTLASAGATGDKTHTCNNSTSLSDSKWGAYLIGLQPGVAGPPTGTLAATEAADAASLSGNISFPAVTGTLAATESADLFSDVAPALFEAWWDFASGAIDATGHGNDGTLHGTTLTTDPYLRAARSFNGTTDYIDGSSSPLEP